MLLIFTGQPLYDWIMLLFVHIPFFLPFDVSFPCALCTNAFDFDVLIYLKSQSTNIPEHETQEKKLISLLVEVLRVTNRTA